MSNYITHLTDMQLETLISRHDVASETNYEQPVAFEPKKRMTWREMNKLTFNAGKEKRARDRRLAKELDR